MDENERRQAGMQEDDPFNVETIRPELRLARAPEDLPHDRRAERALVGAVLAAAGDNYEDVVKIVPTSAFYVSGWRLVMEAVGSLREANLAADGPSVVEYMMAKRVEDGGPPLVERVQWEKERGPLAVLNAVADAPLPVTVDGYARKIAELSVRRQAILDARRICALAESGVVPLADVRKQMEESAERMRTVEAGRPDWRHIGDVAIEVVDTMRAVMEGRPANVFTTGFDGLDKAFGGGLVPGDLMVVGGRPGHGKSAYVLSMAVRAAAKGVGSAIFSLELMESIAARRILAQRARVGSSVLKAGRYFDGTEISNADIESVVYAAHDLAHFPVWINDRPAQTLASIRAGIRKVKGRCPQLGHVIVDYLQIMAMTGSKSASLANVIADTAQALRNMAKEERVAISVLSQLGRDIEKRQDAKPRMSDLRDSGGIEAAATRILFPWRESMMNPTDQSLKDKATLILVKNTDGEANVEIPVRWNGVCQEFADEEVAFVRRHERSASVTEFPRAGNYRDDY